MRRVVITGLGAVTPIGNDVESYLKGLQEGKSGANLITKFDASKFKTQFACEVTDLDTEPYLDRREIRRMDEFSVFAMVAAEQAMKNSGLDLEKIDLDRTGVIWAAGIGGIGTIEEEITAYCEGDGTPRFNPFFVPKMIADIAAGNISIRYGLRGINYATLSACASSTHALMN
ncbi:MAG: beta-ketoacyl-[acyl-carrier-protein] synthase II, partial [Phaeodactylibacter sp.]|nr:beta-ketoacyl-[acyl-carrier-protein] synthase II [Phaeodactylibacter sp.]